MARTHSVSISERLLYLLLALGFVAVAALFGLEVRRMVSTVGFARMGITAILIGTGTGALIGYFLARGSVEVEDKLKNYSIPIVLLAFFAPMAASLSNRLLSSPRLQTYQLVEGQPVYSTPYGLIQGEQPKPDHYLIQVADFDGHFYTFTTDKPIPEGLEKGDSLQVWVRPGFWGFAIFEGLPDD